MKSLLYVCFAVAGFARPQPPATTATPDKTKTYIQNIEYGGTGCPQGSVAIALAQDLTSFTVIFDKFLATSGPTTSVTDTRKNCQINVDLRYPQGFSYTVNTITYRGFVSLPAGVSAVQKANYYFTGETAQVASSSRFTGPLSQDYLTTDEINIANVVYSRCGEVQRGNVNAQVRLEGDLKQQAQITVDSVDGKVKQTYGLSWKKCP